MPFELVAGDKVEVKLYSRLDTQLAVNTRHYVVTAVASGGTDTDHVAEAMADVFPTPLKALMSEKAVYLGLSVRKVNTPFFDISYSGGNTGPGSRIGDAMPPNISGLLSLRTGDGGRVNRGRMYVPFPSEDSNEDVGKPTTAYLDALTDLGDAILQEVVAPGALGSSVTLTPCLFSRKVDQFVPLLSVRRGTDWARQNRRAYRTGGDSFPPLP